MRKEIFRMERVTYKEAEVTKLEDFNLQIYEGEIMGLVPINNHGRAGLLKLLQNNLSIYDGYIYYNGERVNSWKGAVQGSNKISIIQAENSLVESMSITDNIFVLRKGFRQEIIRTSLLNRQLKPFFEEIGMHIPADVRVERLTVFERVVVELLRAVVAGNHLIVIDEIGVLISNEELEKFYEILRHYTKKGCSFLYISPHVEECASICDRLAILFNGHIQRIMLKEAFADEILRVYPAEYDRMVRYHLENRRKNTGKEEELFCWSYCSEEAKKQISFAVNKGECLVVQLQERKLLQELLQMMSGELPLAKESALLEGRETEFIGDRRVAVVQELPTKTMIFPELDYMDNLCMSLSQRMSTIWNSSKIRRSICREYSMYLGDEVFDMQIEELSEKQKYQLVYARVFLQKPKLVFCVSPFQGADLFHRMTIWKILEKFLDHGIALVILSHGLSDALSLADRLLNISSDGTANEIVREEFAEISFQVPWRHLYDKEKEER